MKRNDIVVLENLHQEDDQPRYLVVLAKEIENHAADGSSYDYSLENNDSECEYDMMKAIEKKFGVNTADLSLYGEDNELEACIGSEISDELLTKINELNIGPMGLGGKITALSVKVNLFPCHIASLPVCVNLQCHASRHKEVIL